MRRTVIYEQIEKEKELKKNKKNVPAKKVNKSKQETSIKENNK